MAGRCDQHADCAAPPVQTRPARNAPHAFWGRRCLACSARSEGGQEAIQQSRGSPERGAAGGGGSGAAVQGRRRRLAVAPNHALPHCCFPCRPAAARSAAPQLARAAATRCAAATKEGELTGVVFEPFTAVKYELAVVDRAPTSESYARVDFHPECEAAINEQIK